jgi:hypothetical protein
VVGGGWWDSFRREMLKRRWIGDQSCWTDLCPSDAERGVVSHVTVCIARVLFTSQKLRL